MTQRAIQQTMHRKGTPEYAEHVASEQQAQREWLEGMAGRELTADEAAQLDDAVEDAIARYAR
jgi:hypothetical protein